MAERILLTRDRLSDGSEVCNVCIGGVVLNAVSERDAIALVDKLAAAIRSHTVDEVTIAYT